MRRNGRQLYAVCFWRQGGDGETSPTAKASCTTCVEVHCVYGNIVRRGTLLDSLLSFQNIV